MMYLAMGGPSRGPRPLVRTIARPIRPAVPTRSIAGICDSGSGKRAGRGGQGTRHALVYPRGREAEGTGVRVFGLSMALMTMALSGCAVAVVTGGAIVADEVVEQVEGGGDGLF